MKVERRLKAGRGKEKDRLRRNLSRSTALAVLLGPATLQAWIVIEQTDAMTDETSQYMVQYAEDTIDLGLLAPQARALLGVTCKAVESSYYMRVQETMYGLDGEIECNYGCTSYQRMRMRFDDGPVHTTKWNVWKNHDGATYTETAYTGRGPRWLTEQLRAGKRLRLEIAFRGQSRKVVVFDLNGFTATAKRCGGGAWMEAITASDQEKRKEAEARRKRIEAVKKKAEAERRRIEAARRKTAERARQEQIAREGRELERERLALLDAGRSEYIAQIEDKIERNWLRPPGTASGLKCVVRVSQIPEGEVVQAEIEESSGNIAFDRSVEDAVLRSSPLPIPKDPSLFDRHIVITFEPDG